MKKEDFLKSLLNEEGEATSTASVLGNPGSPTYGGFIGPLGRISKKKLNSRLFHTWKDSSVKNGVGVGRLAVPPQGYIKEHLYSTEGNLVTENDLLEWFGADLSQKPAYNGGKLVAIEPKCLAFPYCSQGAIDKPIKLIGESKDEMCNECYGYCSHIAEETGKSPEFIAKLIREKYLSETIDIVKMDSINESVITQLNESIELLDENYTEENKNLENTNTMENIQLTPQFASECMSGIMENNQLAECMYEALIHEGFLPENLNEGETYEGHCKAMMEDAEICMEMVKSCMMNESSSCANEVANYISECWGNKMGGSEQPIYEDAYWAGVDPEEAGVYLEEDEMEEAAGINPAIYDQLKHCVEHGHSYSEAKAHVAQAVDGWDLSMEDWNEAKKKFGKGERDGVELEEEGWMNEDDLEQEGWMNEGGLEEGGDSTRYMFFSNLEQIKRQADLLLKFDQGKIEAILNSGHDWAADHLAVAKEDMSQVFDFLMNEIEGEGAPEGDITPAPLDMAPVGPKGMEGPEDKLMEYSEEEDMEDDDVAVKGTSDQYEREMKYFTNFMNAIEKSMNTVAKALSSEDIKNKFNQYFGQFESSRDANADEFINFIQKTPEESYVDYCGRIFAKGPNGSILSLLVSPTKRAFLTKTQLDMDDNLTDALDTIDDLQVKAMRKAQFIKDYNEKQDRRHRDMDHDDDFSDEKEPSMGDLKNIEKMGHFDVDNGDDEDFLEENELPKFAPKKGKNVDSENSKNEKEAEDMIKDAESTQKTTEEKVDELKNQKFSPNMETPAHEETKELALGYKNALNLDYSTEPSDDYKKRVEMEVKTGHSRERDAELGDEANIDNESEAGEKIWNASKKNQANADYDWAPNPIVTADQGYEKTSVSGKVKDGSKGNKVNEAVENEIQKMMKMVSYDQAVITEEKKAKQTNEDDIFWKSVSKKKLL